MRKPRQLQQNAEYHVIVQANRQEMILHSKALKNLFLEIVKRARGKYAFSIRTFCIMGNEFHFIIRPLKDENLSRIMQWINSVYAMKYNRIFNLKGHVWYDRFKSKIINDFRQYAAAFIYITENPVRARITKRPEDYEYNGIYFMKKGWYEVVNPPDAATLLVMPGIGQLLIR